MTTGKTSRTKGKSYENTVAKMFRDAGFSNAKRHLEYQGEEAAEGRDLDGTQPFAVQVKCWKRMPPASVIEEIVIDNAGSYTIPVAILKRTMGVGGRKLELAVLPSDVFMHMVAVLNHRGLMPLLSIDNV